jgi:hypothetical protein
MPLGNLSVRIDDTNPLHHLWNNNGTWWVHYTLNFDVRTRRRRCSLGTQSLEEAVRRRDQLFERLRQDGEPVAERVRLPHAVPLTAPTPPIPSPWVQPGGCETSRCAG